MNYLSKTKRASLGFFAAALGMLSLAAIAFGDDLVNNLDASIDATRENLNLTAGGPNGSVGLYVKERNGDGKNGCNLQGNEAAVTFSVTSSDTSVATVSPSSVTLTSCSDTPSLSVTPVSEGSANVTLSQTANTSSGTWDPAPANFSVTVGPATVQNHAPTVATAAGDANGTEGDTLTTSGAFADEDAGDSLTLTADNTEGTFTDNGDGTWGWILPTSDDVAGGTITVTATDSEGAQITDSFDYSAANADPEIGTMTLSGSNCDPQITVPFADAGSDDTHAASIDWGDGSQPTAVDPATTGFQESHHYSSAGAYTVEVTVTDDDGGSDTGSSSQTVNNVASGILSPINPNGSSVFKSGSTVPVKVKITNCDDVAVGGLAPQIAVSKTASGVDSGVNEGIVSTSGADTGTQMRYDSSAGQYIYNLSTKNLAAPNTYKVKVSDPSLDSVVSQDFGIKK